MTDTSRPEQHSAYALAYELHVVTAFCFNLYVMASSAFLGTASSWSAILTTGLVDHCTLASTPLFIAVLEEMARAPGRVFATKQWPYLWPREYPAVVSPGAENLWAVTSATPCRAT